jgi:hypothetical protein
MFNNPRKDKGPAPAGNKHLGRKIIQHLSDEFAFDLSRPPIKNGLSGKLYYYQERKQRGPSSPYYLFKRSQEVYPGELSVPKHPNLTTIEAAASAFYRFIEPELSPKCYVAKNIDGYWIGTREVPGYIPIKHCNKEKKEGICRTQKRYLAALLVSTYLFEETDAHTGNWGIGSNGRIVKIDHDRSFWSLSAKYHDEKNDSYRFNETCKIYEEPASQNFGLISVKEIESLPVLIHTDMKFHPFTPFGLAKIKEFQKDPEFIAWKNFYFLKTLLLDKAIIEEIINAYAFDPNFAKKFIEYLSQRILKLHNVLILSSSFQQFIANFLNTNNNYYVQHFFNEIAQCEQYSKRFPQGQIPYRMIFGAIRHFKERCKTIQHDNLDYSKTIDERYYEFENLITKDKRFMEELGDYMKNPHASDSIDSINKQINERRDNKEQLIRNQEILVIIKSKPNFFLSIKEKKKIVNYIAQNSAPQLSMLPLYEATCCLRCGSAFYPNMRRFNCKLPLCGAVICQKCQAPAKETITDFIHVCKYHLEPTCTPFICELLNLPSPVLRTTQPG